MRIGCAYWVCVLGVVVCVLGVTTTTSQAQNSHRIRIISPSIGVCAVDWCVCRRLVSVLSIGVCAVDEYVCWLYVSHSIVFMYLLCNVTLTLSANAGISALPVDTCILQCSRCCLMRRGAVTAGIVGTHIEAWTSLATSTQALAGTAIHWATEKNSPRQVHLRAPRPQMHTLGLSQSTCLFTHSESHTRIPKISWTCYDENRGIQDLEIYSHADSPILSQSGWCRTKITTWAVNTENVRRRTFRIIFCGSFEHYLVAISGQHQPVSP